MKLEISSLWVGIVEIEKCRVYIYMTIMRILSPNDFHIPVILCVPNISYIVASLIRCWHVSTLEMVLKHHHSNETSRRWWPDWFVMHAWYTLFVYGVDLPLKITFLSFYVFTRQIGCWLAAAASRGQKERKTFWLIFYLSFGWSCLIRGKATEREISKRQERKQKIALELVLPGVCF
jgi:hypothetical protein